MPLTPATHAQKRALFLTQFHNNSNDNYSRISQNHNHLIDESNKNQLSENLQSSTSSRIIGLTTLIISQSGSLQGTVPETSPITLVPLISSSNVLGLLAAGPSSLSSLLMIGIKSGTGMFNSEWTLENFRLENISVDRSSLSCTIFSGNPTSIKTSAFLMRESL